jgi:hypothetical protein
MSAKPIGLPPAILRTGDLPSKKCDPAKLIRISTYKTGEPFFGSGGTNRFDAPGCLHKSAEFSACYLAYDLCVAIAESILHEAMPIDGEFPVASATLQSNYVLHFTGEPLILADLTGAVLKRLGGHADLSATAEYAITQQWSLAIYQNPSNFDGFMYMSRHLNTDKAVILFDRCSHKISMTTADELINYPSFTSAAKTLGIVPPKPITLK